MADHQPTNETWKPVLGYEGLYEVSDLGRVRSLDREVESSNQHGSHVQVRRGRVLKPYVTTTGHLSVSLYGVGGPHRKLIHRLVLEAFESPCPEGKVACHWNDIPADNRLDNLRWDTQSANVLDALRNGLHSSQKITHCPQGHEYTPENSKTVTRSNGMTERWCRACYRNRQRVYQRNYRQRKRDQERLSKEQS